MNEYVFHMIFDFLSFTQMCTEIFKTDALPALYRSLTETHCLTARVVYIRSNKDDKVANIELPIFQRTLE